MKTSGLVALLATLSVVLLVADADWPGARRIARAEARQARMQTQHEVAWARLEVREARLDTRRAVAQAAREARQAAADARREMRQYRERWF
jgi:hypothetical protein